jgi:hypothetical protein
VLFIELPLFTKQITELVADTAYAAFQRELLRQPEKGDLMQHSGGLRKARMAIQGRGKRGGARVIYLFLAQHETIVLFYVYTKAESENLSRDQLKRLKNAVATIKQEFKNETQRN